MKKKLIWFMMTAVLCTAICIGCSKEEERETGFDDRTETTQSGEEDFDTETVDDADDEGQSDAQQEDTAQDTAGSQGYEATEEFYQDTIAPTNQMATLPACFCESGIYQYDPADFISNGWTMEGYTANVNHSLEFVEASDPETAFATEDEIYRISKMEHSYHSAGFIQFSKGEDAIRYYLADCKEEENCTWQEARDNNWHYTMLQTKDLGVDGWDDAAEGTNGLYYPDTTYLENIMEVYGQPTMMRDLSHHPSNPLWQRQNRDYELCWQTEEGWLVLWISESIFNHQSTMYITPRFTTNECFESETRVLEMRRAELNEDNATFYFALDRGIG